MPLPPPPPHPCPRHSGMATVPPSGLGSSDISQFLLLTFDLPVLGGMEKGCPLWGSSGPHTRAHPSLVIPSHTQHKQRASFCPPAAFTANAVLTPITPLPHFGGPTSSLGQGLMGVGAKLGAQEVG